jgi:N-acetylmuramoyl-L-alanine amidase
MINTLFFDGFVDPPTKWVVYLSPESGGNQYAIYNKKDPVKSQYTEHIQMTKVAEKISEILTAKGIEVHIATKEISIRDENNNRAMEANRLNADCYVSLHTNAIEGTNNGKTQGTTCYYNGNNKGSKELSEFIYKEVSALRYWS